MVLLYLACLYLALSYLFAAYLLVRLIGHGRVRVMLMRWIRPSTVCSTQGPDHHQIKQLNHKPYQRKAA